ncbi:MAG: hypothetical protein K8963_01385, partial [Proteobacteria bacterium]|nr:hypothetical protein [Pseudomonadota bacterium]
GGVIENAPMPSPTTYAFWIEPDHPNDAGVSYYRRRDTAANIGYNEIGESFQTYTVSWTNVLVNRANFLSAQAWRHVNGDNTHRVIIGHDSAGKIETEPLNASKHAVKIDYIRLWQRRDRLRENKIRPPIRHLCSVHGCPPPSER